MPWNLDSGPSFWENGKAKAAYSRRKGSWIKALEKKTQADPVKKTQAGIAEICRRQTLPSIFVSSFWIAQTLLILVEFLLASLTWYPISTGGLFLFRKGRQCRWQIAILYLISFFCCRQVFLTLIKFSFFTSKATLCSLGQKLGMKKVLEYVFLIIFSPTLFLFILCWFSDKCIKKLTKEMVQSLEYQNNLNTIAAILPYTGKT